jgi:hypothetical protein
VAAVGVLAALAVGDALRSQSPSPVAGTASTTTAGSPPTSTEELAFSPRQALMHEIEEIGNRWAELFAAGGTRRDCFQMLPEVCERVECVRVEGIIVVPGTKRNCTPAAPAFRESFEGATVQEIVIRKGYLAMVTFSNGHVVEFMGDGGTWSVRRLGDDVPRKFVD